MDDNSELVSQFTAITGADDDRAKFYLESAAWKLDVAMSRYYENENSDPGADVVPVSHDSTPSPTNSTPASAVPPPASSANKATSDKITTISSLNVSSDEEDEEGQAFYAGGSEHSGQQVLGPPKKKDFVAGMFQSIKKYGVERNQLGAGSSKIFHGTGYKLGQTDDDTVKIDGAPEPTETPEVSLKLWKDGFNINDGELRPYTDPANGEFLRSIQRGEIPQELRQGSAEVYLAMEDHRHENFRQTERNLKPFSGQGYTLGSPAPPVVGASGEEDKPANEAKAKSALNVDKSQPTTNLQIRLSDGSRLVQEFNHTHTVADIRAFIVNARPQYERSTFNLLSGYPAKVLNDTETLAEANLLNAAIMQKLV